MLNTKLCSTQPKTDKKNMAIKDASKPWLVKTGYSLTGHKLNEPIIIGEKSKQRF